MSRSGRVTRGVAATAAGPRCDRTPPCACTGRAIHCGRPPVINETPPRAGRSPRRRTAINTTIKPARCRCGRIGQDKTRRRAGLRGGLRAHPFLSAAAAL
jgi:hypothetical protein